MVLMPFVTLRERERTRELVWMFTHSGWCHPFSHICVYWPQTNNTKSFGIYQIAIDRIDQNNEKKPARKKMKQIVKRHTKYTFADSINVSFFARAICQSVLRFWLGKSNTQKKCQQYPERFVGISFCCCFCCGYYFLFICTFYLHFLIRFRFAYRVFWRRFLFSKWKRWDFTKVHNYFAN